MWAHVSSTGSRIVTVPGAWDEPGEWRSRLWYPIFSAAFATLSRTAVEIFHFPDRARDAVVRETFASSATFRNFGLGILSLVSEIHLAVVI